MITAERSADRSKKSESENVDKLGDSKVDLASHDFKRSLQEYFSFFCECVSKNSFLLNKMSARKFALVEILESAEARTDPAKLDKLDFPSACSVGWGCWVGFSPQGCSHNVRVRGHMSKRMGANCEREATGPGAFRKPTARTKTLS